MASRLQVAVFYLKPVEPRPPPHLTRGSPDSCDHNPEEQGHLRLLAQPLAQVLARLLAQLLHQVLARLLARLLAQVLARLLAQLLVQLLSQPLAEHLAKLLAQQEDVCFQEQLQQPGGGAVTHRPQLLLSPVIDCVSNFGFFDVSSAHTARQPRPGAVPASQGAASSGWGELGGNHTAAVVSLPCGQLLLQR